MAVFVQIVSGRSEFGGDNDDLCVTPSTVCFLDLDKNNLLFL